MLTGNRRKQFFHRVLPDLAAFLFGISLAYGLGWSTGDLVWSLWLGSLVIGYATILATIAAGVYLALRLILNPRFPERYRTGSLAGIAGVSLFLLLFFSLHFCAFHAGHASFLTAFFPLQGVEPGDFSAAFMNPLKLWSLVWRDVLPLYGVFLLPVLVSERRAVFSMLLKAFALVREKPLEPEEMIAAAVGQGRKKGKDLGRFFFQPYVNVLRMHVLIFVFAIADAMSIQGFAIYALVYAVYFFPWRIWQDFRDKTA